MKKVMGVVAAALAFAAVPAAPALAQEGQTTCVDVYVGYELLGGGASASPYRCGCGPLLSSQPTDGGTTYTFNLGCWF